MMKWIRLIKGLVYKFRVDFFIPYKKMNFWAHAAEASAWINKNKNLEFNDFFTTKIDHSKRVELFEYILEKENLNDQIDYLEFGVSTGNSFRWWVSKITNKNAVFHGFDTFTGLPEAWGIYEKGAMSNGNEPPKIDDDRIQFYQGLFQQTLIPFLKNYNSKNRKLIHLDADIYSATLYVLTLLTPFLNSGDIILFDEFNVPMHEFKAFKEWTESFYIEYEVLGAINNFYQVAIKIK